MAITRVNSASITNTGGTTSATATIPGGTGILAGDLIIVCAGSQTGHTTNGISVKDAVNNTNFTTILETDLGGASTRWMQTFAFVTPVNIADGTVFTCTGYATATNTEFSVDVFRGATATISRAAVGSSNASSTSSAAPALASAPPAGDLALTFCMAGSGTLTPAAPFTKGSSGTSGASTAIGYVLSADGSSTYGSTWTLGTANTSAAQTVSFTAATAASAVWLPTPQGERRQPVRPRRRAATQPVPQADVPVPFVQPRQPREIRLLITSRGRVRYVTPPQVVVTPPAWTPVAIRARLKPLMARRGRAAVVTPPQITITPPAWVPPAVRARLKPLLRRRGVAVGPPAEQVRVPLVSRIRLRLANLRRGKTAQVGPPQVVVAPPVWPTQGTRERAVLRSLRRPKPVVNGWLVGAAPQALFGARIRPGTISTGIPTGTAATTLADSTATSTIAAGTGSARISSSPAAAHLDDTTT